MVLRPTARQKSFRSMASLARRALNFESPPELADAMVGSRLRELGCQMAERNLRQVGRPRSAFVGLAPRRV